MGKKHKRHHASGEAAREAKAPKSSGDEGAAAGERGRAELNPAHTGPEATKELHATFAAGAPFPHLHVKDFLQDPSFLEVVKAQLEAQAFAEKVRRPCVSIFWSWHSSLAPPPPPPPAEQ